MTAIYRTLDPRTKLPAGRYYIGDPCYVIRDDEWQDALNSTRYFGLFVRGTSGDYMPRQCQNGVFERNGVLFAASTTKYGDGCYPCLDAGELIGECGVDAGMIGAIPLEMIDEEYVNKQYSQGLEGLGCIVDIDNPFTIDYADGTIEFDTFEVLTGDDCEGWELDEEEEFA